MVEPLRTKGGGGGREARLVGCERPMVGYYWTIRAMKRCKEQRVKRVQRNWAGRNKKKKCGE